MVYDSWEFMVWHVDEAIEAGEWDECSDILHSGRMAVVVNGLPRIIEGTIH
jgi:hypothetical protein